MGFEYEATRVARHSRADEEARLRDIGEQKLDVSHMETSAA